MKKGPIVNVPNGTAVVLSIAICLLFAPLQVVAQEPVEPETDDEATHEALRTLRKDVQVSFNKAGQSGKLEDLEGVLDYVHDDVVLAAMNGELVVGKEGVIDYFNRKITGDSRPVKSIYHEFKPAGLTILYGGDTGVAYGTSLGRYELTSGMSFEVDTNWTSTLVKDGDRWSIASFQFAPSIFDNPVLDTAVRSLYWGVGISGIVGLLLGFLFGRFMARGRRTA